MSDHYGTMAETASLLPRGGGDSNKTVAERLQVTVRAATNVYWQQTLLELMYSTTLNSIMLVQLIAAAAITVLAALPGDYSLTIAVLGGASTFAAGIQARYKGANLPERAGAHAASVSALLRECEYLITDCGDHNGHDYNARIHELRRRFEIIEDLADRAERGEMHAGEAAGGAAPPAPADVPIGMPPSLLSAMKVQPAAQNATAPPAAAKPAVPSPAPAAPAAPTAPAAPDTKAPSAASDTSSPAV